MKRWIAGLFVVGLLCALGWGIYYKIKTAVPPMERRGERTRPVPVETASVRRGEIRDVRLFTGTLTPKSRVILAPKVAGRLEQLTVNIGDPVENGQLVAILDSAEYEQQLEQARADLLVAEAQIEQARTQLENTEREYDRVRQLHEGNIASTAELDKAESDYKTQLSRLKVSEAQLEERHAALRAAEIRHAYTRIIASWEGSDPMRFVGERFVDEGAMLNANSPIVSIVELNPLTAVIAVIERDYPKMRIQQDALVTTDAFPGRVFPGKIIRIAPVLKEESRTARVEIEVPNPEETLKPGMFVRASIELARREDALLIPYAAVVKREGREGVFQVETETQTARFIPITVGIVNGDTVEALDPPLEGPLVTMGRHLLVDGSPVMIPGEDTADPERVTTPKAPEEASGKESGGAGKHP